MQYSLFMTPHLPSACYMKCGLDNTLATLLDHDVTLRMEVRALDGDIKMSKELGKWQSNPRLHISRFIYRREGNLMCLSHCCLEFSMIFIIHQ